MALNSQTYDSNDASGAYSTRGESGRSNTIVGIFARTQDARSAVKDLHKGKFKQTWLGITKPSDNATGEPLVEDPNPLSRFFSADRMSLHRALLDHGVSESQAEQIEEDIAPGCAVLTVYGEDDPVRVSELLRQNKGHVIDAGSELPSAVSIAGSRSGDSELTTSERYESEPRQDAEPRHEELWAADDEVYGYNEAEFVEWRPRTGV